MTAICCALAALFTYAALTAGPDRVEYRTPPAEHHTTIVGPKENKPMTQHRSTLKTAPQDPNPPTPEAQS